MGLPLWDGRELGLWARRPWQPQQDCRQGPGKWPLQKRHLLALGEPPMATAFHLPGCLSACFEAPHVQSTAFAGATLSVLHVAPLLQVPFSVAGAALRGAGGATLQWGWRLHPLWCLQNSRAMGDPFCGFHVL